MTSSCICQEQCVDSTALQQLRQLYPVSECSLGRRLVFGILCSCQRFGPSNSVPIPTFHCPGDRCPTVDMSKALSKICFLPVPAAEPFRLVAALSPMICCFQGQICFLSSLAFETSSRKFKKVPAKVYKSDTTPHVSTQKRSEGRLCLDVLPPASCQLRIRPSHTYLAPSTVRKRGTTNLRALTDEFLEPHMACRGPNIRHHPHSNRNIILWIYLTSKR